MNIESDEDQFYRQVVQYISSATPPEILSLWNDSFNMGYKGEIVRSLIDRNIFNIGDRYSLFRKRPSIEELSFQYDDELFYRELTEKSPEASERLLLDLNKNFSEKNLQHLAGALFNGHFNNSGDLGLAVYILLKYDGKEFEQLLESIFENPTYFVKTERGNVAKQKERQEQTFYDALVYYLKEERNEKVAIELEKFAPSVQWRAIKRLLGYDPIEEYATPEIEMKSFDARAPSYQDEDEDRDSDNEDKEDSEDTEETE